MHEPTREDTEALREQVTDVLAGLGLRLSPDKTRVVRMSEGFDFLGRRIQWRRKRGTNKVARLHLHRRPADPVGEDEDPCPDPQDIATRPGVRADRLEHGHARVGQPLQARDREEHVRDAGQLRLAASDPDASSTAPLEMEGRPSTVHHPTGRWLPISEGDTELLPTAGIPVTRYRYRASRIPNPWTLQPA